MGRTAKNITNAMVDKTPSMIPLTDGGKSFTETNTRHDGV